MKKKKIVHPLHTLVGKEFRKFFKSGKKFDLILDPACGGIQNIPFFLHKAKPKRAVWFTNVDLIVTEGNKVKLVCEIDESNVKPGHIFGKFLSLISSSLCILKDGTEYYFDEKLTFVQVLSNEKYKLKKYSQKEDQWLNIEKSIKTNFKAFNKLKSIEYHIVLGDDKTLDTKKLYAILSKL